MVNGIHDEITILPHWFRPALRRDRVHHRKGNLGQYAARGHHCPPHLGPVLAHHRFNYIRLRGTQASPCPHIHRWGACCLHGVHSASHGYLRVSLPLLHLCRGDVGRGFWYRGARRPPAGLAQEGGLLPDLIAGPDQDNSRPARTVNHGHVPIYCPLLRRRVPHFPSH